jgi:hypothetical protein
MDTHPWTQYEVARLRDEERLFRARDAMRARELPRHDGNGTTARAVSWLDRLLRRDPAPEGATVRPRPV